MTPDAPPAIHLSIDAHAIDHERLLRVILVLEDTPWSAPGGALCFMPGSWKEETGLPYRLASHPAQATIIAKCRLRRFAAIARAGGVEPTPLLLLESWRHGIASAMNRHRRQRMSEYASRGENLYLDKTFP